MKPNPEKLKSVFKDISRLFGKLHPSNSEQEILMATAKISQKLEAAGLHIGDLGNFLFPEGDDFMDMFANLLKKDVDFLIEMARNKARFFSTIEGRCYTDVVEDGHRRTILAKSRAFELWLRNQYFIEKKGQAVASGVLKTCVETLEAITLSGKGESCEVHLRTAMLANCVYLDLCDAGHTVIEVTATGWRIVLDPPVRFRRTPSMLPLPLPTSGGSIDLLRPFVNLDKNGFVLLVCCLVDAIIAGHPHPVLFLAGEEGSAKTTLAKLCRALFDPSKVPTKNLAGTVRNLFVEVENSYGLIFDNVSKIPHPISDALCMAVTGSGLSDRTLYTNKEMSLRGGGTHPIWLTGLRNVITRSDLADRSIILNLPYISGDRRRPESEVNRDFEGQQSLILGALLDLVSLTLKNLPTVRPAAMPRMADFARVATACETGFVDAGSFAKAYAQSAGEAARVVVEEELTGVALAVLAYMRRHKKWKGTSTQLLATLTENDLTEECVTKFKSWPTDGRTFGAALTTATPVLRKLGWEIKRWKGGGHVQVRTIEIRPAPPEKRRQADKDKIFADKGQPYEGDKESGDTIVFAAPHNKKYGGKT